MATLVAFDTETFPICDDHVIPPLVCLSYALQTESGIQSGIAVIHNREDLKAVVEDLLTNPEYVVIGHNLAFDMAVVGQEFPEFWPDIFKIYSEGRARCTKLWEKEWRVSTLGELQFERLPSGVAVRLRYSLADLEKRHLGRDRSAEKNKDSWRLHYRMLADRALAYWPERAVKYAIADAVGTLEVHLEQLKKTTEVKHGSTNSHDIDVAADFGLFLTTATGMATDPDRWHQLKEWLTEELSSENMKALIGAGILRPAVSPKPKGKSKILWREPKGYSWQQVLTNVEVESGVPAPRTKAGKLSISRQSRENYWEILSIKGEGSAKERDQKEPWVEYFFSLREVEESKGRTRGKPETIAEKKLRELVAELCHAKGLEPVLSAKTREPSLAVDALEQLTGFSPVVDEFVRRKKVAKLVTTELPRMCFRNDQGIPIEGAVAPVVHFNFDCIKETFRTSSFAGDLYASANGQNVDPRARGMYVARPGHVLCSSDYSALELRSLADKLEMLFGSSVLGTLIRSGVDPHAYLGSQLAYTLDENFREEISKSKIKSPEEIYKVFLRAKDHDSDEVQAFFKHFRTFAKPTGLGYPGGLGPKTFVSYAWNNYRIRVDLDTAKMLREVWFSTFPEMRSYFEWVKTNCRDLNNDTIGLREDDSPIQGYAYEAPGGAFRAGCPYTACCNGAALQSPAALGAKIAIFDVQRACYDKSMGSILYECRMVNFVHDEILIEFPDDHTAADKAAEVSRLMREAMSIVIPRVPVQTEACLMYRWDKNAKPVYNVEGRLIPWRSSNGSQEDKPQDSPQEDSQE